MNISETCGMGFHKYGYIKYLYYEILATKNNM